MTGTFISEYTSEPIKVGDSVKQLNSKLLGNLSPCIYKNSSYTESSEKYTEDTDHNYEYKNSV